MKVATEIPQPDTSAPPPSINEIKLPEGLIGFPEFRRMELVYVPDQLPFLWLRLLGAEPVNFVVLEPGGFIADYEPELFDEDANLLGIVDPADVMVLNIVCLKTGHPEQATVNLAGPIIINRRTQLGKQVVLANHSRFSAHHPLMGQTSANA